MRIVISRMYDCYRGKGFWYVFRRVLQELWFRIGILPRKALVCLYYNMFRKSKVGSFSFLDRAYEYIYHPYNFTWENERTVELPILWQFVNQAAGKRILEIGNVLSYYYNHKHDVVDKYERRSGIINQDVVDFQPKHCYDLIVSCSTLEHVGWDKPDEKDPEKIIQALDNLKSCLNPRGLIVVTFPLGYNAFLDQHLYEERLPFTEMYFLKRISVNNQWQQVSFDDVKGSKFNTPFPWANGLAVGLIRA